MRTLRSDGLTLEPQTATHADEMFALLRDPALYAFLDETPPPSAAWLRCRYRKLEVRLSPGWDERWLNWVVRADDGQAIGFVQATVHLGGLAEIAFVLGRAHWGRGLAYRAVHTMIGELIGRYGAKRLVATAAGANARSVRLLERLGLREVRPAPGDWHRPLAPGDRCFALDARDFPAQQPS